MAESVQQILERLAEIAKAWRASGAETAPPAQVDAFRRLLDQLYAQEWDYALGEQNELPDSQLPERYLTRRAELLDDLELELGEVATEWVKSRGGPGEAAALRRYAEVMEELFRIGHWSGEPDFESLLPDDLMPAVYLEQRKARIAEHRARQKGQPEKRK